jgi:hypothetical protein
MSVLESMKDLHPDGAAQFREFQQVVERCTTVRDLKALSRDFLEWVKGLSTRDRDFIDRRLHAVFGRGLEGGVANEAEVLARVSRRGRIVSEQEYRLVLARVDEIYADKRHRDELKHLNTLLQAFDGR